MIIKLIRSFNNKFNILEIFIKYFIDTLYINIRESLIAFF